MIPKDLPPRSTPFGSFSRWRNTGLFGQINHHLVMADRKCIGREASPSAAVRTCHVRYPRNEHSASSQAAARAIKATRLPKLPILAILRLGPPTEGMRMIGLRLFQVDVGRAAIHARFFGRAFAVLISILMTAMTEHTDTPADAAKSISIGVLGLSGAAWDKLLIWSLSLAALVAGAVLVTAAGSIITHKREAKDAALGLDYQKQIVASKVAEAKTEGLNAGKAMGEALIRAAQFEKEAAVARLEQERMHALNLQLEQKIQRLKPRTISVKQKETFVENFSKSGADQSAFIVVADFSCSDCASYSTKISDLVRIATESETRNSTALSTVARVKTSGLGERSKSGLGVFKSCAPRFETYRRSFIEALRAAKIDYDEIENMPLSNNPEDKIVIVITSPAL